jgi:uroporphyrinogen-III synthase
MARVLVLRPEPGASETLRRARNHGLDALAIPLFEIEPVKWQAPDPAGFDGLLLTSANAVRNAGRQLDRVRDLGVYAVGEATAAAARNERFAILTVGEGGVEQLLESIPAGLRLLHLCGAHGTEVAGARQAITPVAVYRSKAIEAPDLPGGAGNVALIHSPRAGRRFAELTGNRGSIAIAAISPAAAKAAGDGWKVIEAAERPTDDALLALAARLCNNPPPK